MFLILGGFVFSCLMNIIGCGRDEPRDDTKDSFASVIDDTKGLNPANNADLAKLIRRAAHRDYRVRQTVYAKLNSISPWPEALPHRDTPIAARESQLLAWLTKANPSIKTYPPQEMITLGTQAWCDLFADTSDLQFGPPLRETCFACHAPHLTTQALTSFELLAKNCTECHSAVHNSWQRSSHANSLTHLRLNTVNPENREPEALNPTDYTPPGLTCTDCHAAVHENTNHGCIAVFKPQPLDQACSRCHAETAAQWRGWAQSPRYESVQWPPGQIQWIESDTARTCVDCHMPKELVGKQSDHRLTARRSPELLRQAADLRVFRSRGTSFGEQGPLVVRLTNLTGHQLPTGTKRHRVTLLVEQADGTQHQLASFIGASGKGMAPADQQTYIVPEAWLEAGPIRIALIYTRDQEIGDPMIFQMIKLTHPPRANSTNL